MASSGLDPIARLGPVVGSVLVVAALLAVLPGEDRRERSRPAATGPVPGVAFVQAYERSRTAELVIDAEVTRTFPDGRELAYERRIVQQPPDNRLVIGAGAATGRLNGRIIRCNTDGSSPPTCVDGPPAEPYAEEVADELDNLRDLLSTAYETTIDDDGCYELRLVALLPLPPYGLSARFCFDDATGALATQEVQRSEAVERTVAVDIRTEVTPADLRATDIGEPIGTG